MNQFDIDFKKYFIESLKVIPKDSCISLSGGIDSSSILYGLAEISNIPVEAITFQIGDKETKDLFFTKKICNYFNIPLKIAKIPFKTKEELEPEIKEVKESINLVRSIDIQCLWAYSKMLPLVESKNLIFGFYEAVLFKVDRDILIKYRKVNKGIYDKEEFNNYYRKARIDVFNNKRYNNYIIEDWIRNKEFGCFSPFLDKNLREFCWNYNFYDFHIKDEKFKQKAAVVDIFKDKFDIIGNANNKGNFHVVGGIKEYHTKVLLENTPHKNVISAYNRI